VNIPEGKGEVSAEIMQILAHRSGKLHIMSLRQLCKYYFPSHDRDFIKECLEDLDHGDYPISLDGGELAVCTNKERAEHLIIEIRDAVYSDG